MNVYVINIEEYTPEKAPDELTDQEFKAIAELQGGTYPIKTFECAFNMGDINSDVDMIRILGE